MLRLLPVFLVVLVGCAMGPRSGDVKSGVMTQADQQSMTPAMALKRLQDGNARFQSSMGSSFDYVAQARESTKGQFPMAYVLSCVDSRVPPEAIFDCGIGDLFVGRVAGNFENVDQLGSMEFATKAAGVPLIVVLGHSACGAVKGACDHVKLADNLTSLLENIGPAVESAEAPGERNSKNSAFVASVVTKNVMNTIADIPQRSATIRELIAAGELAIVGGVYDLGTGRVDWISVPQM